MAARRFNSGIDCPYIFDIAFARRLFISLNIPTAKTVIDDKDCLDELGMKFSSYRRVVEQYFEAARTGDPAYAARCMAMYCGSDREWAERVIEAARTGDPILAARLMVKHCGSSREWATRVIAAAGGDVIEDPDVDLVAWNED